VTKGSVCKNTLMIIPLICETKLQSWEKAKERGDLQDTR
jgi:hypothetical protein